MDEKQRIQMKILISILGGLLLLLLFLGKVLVSIWREKPEEMVPVALIEKYYNVWIIESDAEKMLVYMDGAEELYDYANEAGDWNGIREQVADITLTDGKVSGVLLKTQKISGKVLSVDEEGVELEDYGKIPLASDYRGYRIYNTLEMCTVTDLPFGYAFADFVLEDGAICAILLAKEEALEYIRVLLKAADYSGLLHEQLVVTSDSDFTIQYGNHDNPQIEKYAAGTEIRIERGSDYLAGGRVYIRPNVITGKVFLPDVTRNQGVAGYRGHLELLNTQEGIAVINEVSLEEYLYSVVPSEMPSSYPGEALAAQAICARTYAYGHMLHAGYPRYGAHVDDSTSYQVYNNILEQESTTTAVKETYGQLLYTQEGALAETYYYSTSCGVGSDANVWKTQAAKSLTYLKARAVNPTAMSAAVRGEEPLADEIGEKLREEENFAAFISAVNADDFEASEGWYRWSYRVEEIDKERLLGILQKRYEVNKNLVLTLEDGEFVSRPIEELEKIRTLYVGQRGAGGIAQELVIETGQHTYKVITEHNIRYVLNNGESKIIRQDGSEIASPSLLPSGFFVVSLTEGEEGVTGYTLTGGGFGHGVGMSQNAAKNMAKNGYTAQEILLFFYDNCVIRNIYR